MMHLNQAPGQALQEASPSPAGGEHTRRIETRLRGRVLVIARALWLLIALFEVGVLLINLPTFIALLHTACSDATGVTCNYLQLRSAQLPALAHYGFSLDDYALYALICDLVVTLLLLSVGTLIFWHKSAEFMGLFVSLLLLTFGCFGISEVHLVIDPPFEGNPIVALLAILQWPALGILFYTFPDGRFVPRWSWMLTSLFVIQFGFFALPYPYNLDNWPPLLGMLETLVVYGSAVGTQLYRYRQVASPLQRLQIKWLAFGFATTLVFYIIWSLLPLVIPSLTRADSWYPLFGSAVLVLIYVPIPLGIGIALLRYRLWDIDILINRTLVYGLLTACTLGLYVLVVFGASALLRTQNDLFFSLLATALIAVLFQPLRHWLQHGVNRLMFGERNEPYRVLSRLGQRLEETLPAESFLPTIVQTVAQALKLPYVAILWKRESGLGGAEPSLLAAAFGTSSPSVAETRVPLVHQGKQVGELVLAARQRGEELTPADLRLVRDLAPQIGVAVHAARLTGDLQRLTADLQRSREHLVTAREEERRRLRRDLHDGLGPILASLTFKVDAARNVLRQDEEKADRLLVEVRQRAQEAIIDIRRLVYNLRPPALDELGLLSALREQAVPYQYQGLAVVCDLPQALPGLPAAVEVAVYRITQEALTNVARHAEAQCCLLRLSINHHTLSLDISDDGKGIPASHRMGVGLHAMHERTSELGGTCLVTRSASGGTLIQVSLPLPSEQESMASAASSESNAGSPEE